MEEASFPEDVQARGKGGSTERWLWSWKVSCALVRALRVVARELAETRCVPRTLHSPFHGQSTSPAASAMASPTVVKAEPSDGLAVSVLERFSMGWSRPGEDLGALHRGLQALPWPFSQHTSRGAHACSRVPHMLAPMHGRRKSDSEITVGV